MKEKILVSACLLGDTCKYNGKDNKNDAVLAYIKDKEVIKICPEVMGGLPTPRIPCEILNGKVFNQKGEEKTKEYVEGANIALQLALENNVKKAILKSKSPSCGKCFVYDGTFSKKLIPGSGICASLLMKHGLRIWEENEIEEQTHNGK